MSSTVARMETTAYWNREDKILIKGLGEIFPEALNNYLL